MKRILIKLQNDPEILSLTDDVEVETDIYIKELSNLFQSEKVLFLQTTHENILLKPSLIEYVKVSDIQKRGKKKQSVDGTPEDETELEIEPEVTEPEVIDMVK